MISQPDLTELQAAYEKCAAANLDLIRLYQRIECGLHNHATGEGYMIGHSYDRFRAKADILKHILSINPPTNAPAT